MKNIIKILKLSWLFFIAQLASYMLILFLYLILPLPPFLSSFALIVSFLLGLGIFLFTRKYFVKKSSIVTPAVILCMAIVLIPMLSLEVSDKYMEINRRQ